MATIRTAIQIIDGMSSPLRSINNAMNIVLNSFESIQNASHNAIDTNSIRAARAELNAASSSFARIEQEIRQSDQQQQQFNRDIRNGQAAAASLESKIKGFVGVLAGAVAIKEGINITDSYINQNSRLALINDGLQTQAELQQKIYQAAQRSRAEYGDTVSTVAKLGLLAKDAFKNNNETIRFAELMNKSFKISGSSASEASNGMYQLTQAMASGRLQGDEFRSVMENAPMLAQAIAKYTGKSMGDLRKMSAEGEISADIIKNSLFSAADDIEKKFAKMPMTFETVWISIKNKATIQFSSIMQKVNDYINSVEGAQVINSITNSIGILAGWVNNLLTVIMAVSSFVVNNWSWIAPTVLGIVAAMLAWQEVTIAVGAVSGIIADITALVGFLKMATWGAAVAQYGLAGAMLFTVGIILFVILAIVAICTAFTLMQNKSASAIGTVCAYLMFFVALFNNVGVAILNTIIGIINTIWNVVASLVEFFANAWNHPIASVEKLFVDLAKSVLGVLKIIGDAIDDLLGTHMSSTLDDWMWNLNNTSNAIAAQNNMWTAPKDIIKYKFQSMDYQQAMNSGYDFGKGIEDKFDISTLNGLGNDVSNTALNTAAMKDSMNSSEEDLKYLRDLAEQEIINRFTTAEIKVDMPVSASINSEMDLDGIVSHLEQKVYETMAVAAEGVHS